MYSDENMDCARFEIGSQKLFELKDTGIQIDNVGFGTITMGSKHVCVKEPKQVAIIDIFDANKVTKIPMTADSVVLNPSKMILALKSSSTVIIYDINKNCTVMSCCISDIVLMKWVEDEEIALIGRDSVFHWNVNAARNSEPRKIFERDSELSDFQILDYRANHNQKWLVLYGTMEYVDEQQHGRTEGRMQIYSVEKKTSDCIAGYAPALGQLTGRNHNLMTLICFALMNDSKQFVMMVLELKVPKSEIFHEDRVIENLQEDDYPVSIEICPKDEIIYMFTKCCCVKVFNMRKALLLGSTRIAELVIVTAPHFPGIIGIDTKGQVNHYTCSNSRYKKRFCRDFGLAGFGFSDDEDDLTQSGKKVTYFGKGGLEDCITWVKQMAKKCHDMDAEVAEIGLLFNKDCSKILLIKQDEKFVLPTIDYCIAFLKVEDIMTEKSFHEDPVDIDNCGSESKKYRCHFSFGIEWEPISDFYSWHKHTEVTASSIDDIVPEVLGKLKSKGLPLN